MTATQAAAEQSEAIHHVVFWLAELVEAIPGARAPQPQVVHDWALILLDEFPLKTFGPSTRRIVLRSCRRLPAIAEIIELLKTHGDSKPAATEPRIGVDEGVSIKERGFLKLLKNGIAAKLAPHLLQLRFNNIRDQCPQIWPQVEHEYASLLSDIEEQLARRADAAARA